MANNERDVTKERFWRETLGRFATGGLSVRAFCRRERLTEASFYAWRRTIAERDLHARRSARANHPASAQSQHTAKVSVPQSAVAEADGFIGPTIGRSGYRTAAEFDSALGAKYQQLVDQGHSLTMGRVAQGLVQNDPLAVGTEVDTFARTGLRDWLQNVEGIEEGPGRFVQVNRRLYDPTGSGAYRIPDVYFPGAGSIYDATIAEKTISWQQTIDFNTFSGGANVTIVRPSTLITPGAQGSYGLHFP